MLGSGECLADLALAFRVSPNPLDVALLRAVGDAAFCNESACRRSETDGVEQCPAVAAILGWRLRVTHTGRLYRHTRPFKGRGLAFSQLIQSINAPPKICELVNTQSTAPEERGSSRA